jgi:8-oxo-dGTP pyrophosphatase MutT (NUDIX family)
VGISPYLRHLRERVGHDLLLIPGVAVLPWDEDGRLLLARVRQTGLWQTVGGSVEPDESPYEAALRETREEAGVSIQIDRVRTVVGGPQFRMSYPNGDLVSFVSTVFDAHLLEGEPRPDGEETSEVAWFSAEDLGKARLTEFTLALFAAAGIRRPARGREDFTRARDRRSSRW